MFEIAKADDRLVEIDSKGVKVVFNVAEGTISAGLAVGDIQGPGEFEIGDVAIKAIASKSGQTLYNAEVGGVHVGIIGGCEEGLDDLGVTEVLCTSSTRAVRELEPRLVVSMGNIDGMTSELKLTARVEKKLKIKNFDALPMNLEVVAIS